MWRKKGRLDMSTNDSNTSILDQLKAAVSARKDSLAELRSRLETLIAEIPVGVVLIDDEGKVGRIVRVCTGASQWSNCTWDVTIKGKGLVVDGDKLATETCDRSYWDGNNMHHHSTEPFCLYLGPQEDKQELTWLSGKDTRALAVRLPRAIERYIAECVAEKEANQATAQAV